MEMQRRCPVLVGLKYSLQHTSSLVSSDVVLEYDVLLVQLSTAAIIGAQQIADYPLHMISLVCTLLCQLADNQ